MRFDLLVSVTLSLLCQYSPARVDPSDLHCGSHSLYIALQAQGLGPPTFAEFARQLGPPGSSGYSMHYLEREASRLGAHTVAVETSLENLQARMERFACITIINDHHFVLLYDVDDKNVLIIDPPKAYPLPIDSFLSIWGHKALLVGPSPFVPEEQIRRRGSLASVTGVLAALIAVVLLVPLYRRKRRRRIGRRTAGILSLIVVCATLTTAGCTRGLPSGFAASSGRTPEGSTSIILDPESHELAPVFSRSPQGKVDVKTLVRNLGTSPLLIHEVRTDCSCTLVSLDRDRIEPGAEAALTVGIKLGDSPEPRRTFVSLISNDKSRPVARVRIEWEVMNPLKAVPPSIELPGLDQISTRTATSELSLNGTPFCERCSVGVQPDSPLIACTWVPAEHRSYSPHQTEVSPENRVTLGRLTLTASCRGEDRIFRQGVSVLIRCGEVERARLFLPVTWSVRRAIAVTPSRIWLGSCKPNEVLVRTILVRSSDQKLIEIKKIRCQNESLLVPSHYELGSSATHEIALRFQAPVSPGFHRTLLRIETDSEEMPLIEVPLSLHVAGL